ncbi:hypothetical protein DBR32_01285 [Taibaiella sp. KBW10]|uniref:hypothetical protein n=1 Tax=Taibaiella sp. KBW10 TaxID=2153357 RepID=UPI000F59C35C|nr:hypothetical protein [Taibaiella sp. KBW10]RQO32271.1 hypothetical protein DBR32_01285 [Taibaiella sp. KBW10]
MKALIVYSLYCCFLLVMGATGYAKASAAPHVKDARRDKKITYRGSRELSVAWDDYQGYTLLLLHREQQEDSVIVSGKVNTAFTCRRGGKVSSEVMKYMEQDIVYTDSIDLSGPSRKQRYYYSFMYSSDKVYLRQNTQNGSKLYYAIGGTDSVRIDYYLKDGPVHTYTTFNNRGDSTLKIYTQSGTLEAFSFDTLIKKLTIHCTKMYHANGRIKSLCYYYRDKPCLTWSFYSEKGSLLKKQQHASYATLLKESGEGFGLLPPPVEVFRSVEQGPEFPKGYDAFVTEIRSVLRDVVYNLQYDLNGTYNIVYKITREGGTELINIEGQFNQVLMPMYKERLARLPLWRPGKLNGRPVEITNSMRISVE